MAKQPAHDDLLDIQGNLVGFLKDHQRLLFVNFPDPASGKRFVGAMADEVNSASEVRAYNRRYKDMVKRHEDLLSEPADWVNVALRASGLALIAAPGHETFPQAFQQGMRERAAELGDVDSSDPSAWVRAFAPAAPAVHAVVIIAADLPDLLDDRTSKVREIIQSSGVSENPANAEDGNARPGEFRGHEHFGFKDGISQPSIPGLVSSSRGGDSIAAGEFVLGYEDQDGHVAGTAVPQAEHPTQPSVPGIPIQRRRPPLTCLRGRAMALFWSTGD